MKYLKSLSIAATLAAGIAIPASADTELTMYYPIAVGGSLTQVVDGIVADFEAENPDIKVMLFILEITMIRVFAHYLH